MADQKFTTGNQVGSGSSQGFEKAAVKATITSKNVTDQALSASREIKDKAAGLVDLRLSRIRPQNLLIPPRMSLPGQPTN